MSEFNRHFEKRIEVSASPQEVFEYADDPNNFSSHMNESSMLMAGAKMETKVDEGGGKKVGSHIKMGGNVLGAKLFLDEVITEHEPPKLKVWHTVGDLNLIVIDHYSLGFEIEPQDNHSNLRVFIDYNLPNSLKTRWLGYMFGGIYAKWCVNQMVNGVKEHFKNGN